MTLQVIGAGFGRTGTLSLKQALEKLLGGPCYHMMECMARPEHAGLWRAAERRENVSWDDLFGDFRATVDWPSTRFWRELSEAYPDAKVVLSLRDPERWYQSASETIFRVMNTVMPEGVEPPENLIMVQELIKQGTFDSRLDDREHAIEIYQAHNEAVKQAIDPARLLVFEARQGWPPLCEFLGVPIPDGDYPRVNTRDDFPKLFERPPDDS
jgi:hypothetical protein